MNKKNYNQENMDPELEGMLADLHNIPPRNPIKAAQTKANFIAELDERLQARVPDKKSNPINKLKEQFNMATPQLKFLYITATLIAVVGVLLFGGAGITAVAASNTLPGDRLFTFKSGVEQVRLRLTSQEEGKVRLNLEFAQRRLVEIKALLEEGRLDDVDQAVNLYERYIQEALSGLATIRIQDPERAQEIYNQIAASVGRYSLTLQEISSSFSDDRLPSFNKAIQFSESASTYNGEIEFFGSVEQMTSAYWIISGQKVLITAATEIEDAIQTNDEVHVEAWFDTQGNIYAKEIERLRDDDLNISDDDEFMGIVDEIHPDYWIINGMRFERSSTTRIDDDIKVGDIVEVEVRQADNGRFYLVEIELEFERPDNMDDDDDDDMDDDDDDDMDDDDDDDMDDDNDDDDIDDDNDDDDIDDDDDDDMDDDDDDNVDDDDMDDDDDDDMNNDDDDDMDDDDDDDMDDDDDDDIDDDDDDDMDDDDDDDDIDDDNDIDDDD